VENDRARGGGAHRAAARHQGRSTRGGPEIGGLVQGSSCTLPGGLSIFYRGFIRILIPGVYPISRYRGFIRILSGFIGIPRMDPEIWSPPRVYDGTRQRRRGAPRRRALRHLTYDCHPVRLTLIQSKNEFRSITVTASRPSPIDPFFLFSPFVDGQNTFSFVLLSFSGGKTPT